MDQSDALLVVPSGLSSNRGLASHPSSAPELKLSGALVPFKVDAKETKSVFDVSRSLTTASDAMLLLHQLDAQRLQIIRDSNKLHAILMDDSVKDKLTPFANALTTIQATVSCFWFCLSIFLIIPHPSFTPLLFVSSDGDSCSGQYAHACSARHEFCLIG